MKLKETLNLGKTAFPMRAGLPTKEPVWQKEWEDAKLYQRRQELNEGKPHFTLHDGPPYANGKYSRGTCHEQDLKRYHCSFQIYVRILRPLYPRLGYPWFAN